MAANKRTPPATPATAAREGAAEAGVADSAAAAERVPAVEGVDGGLDSRGSPVPRSATLPIGGPASGVEAAAGAEAGAGTAPDGAGRRSE
jgi:hypothetical protein